MNPFFSVGHLLLVSVVIIAVGGLCAWRSAGKCRGSVRWLITVSRVLGLACLAVIAFNLGRWQEIHQEKASEWAILLDRSLSMGTRDVNGASRWRAGCRIASKALRAAKDPADVKLYTFTDRLEGVTRNDLSVLVPDGERTDILRAGRELLGRHHSGAKRLAGVILISDGRQLGMGANADLGARARAQESPIFPLVLGGKVGRRDLWIKAGRRQYISFVGQTVKITALVGCEGLGKISPVVQLFGPSGKKLGEQQVAMSAGIAGISAGGDVSDTRGGNAAAVDFRVTATERGYAEYVLKAALPLSVPEDVASNNQAAVGLAVLDTKIRILTVEGTPYWDSKFLTQLLREQPNMAVTSVYRLSSERFFKVETDAGQVATADAAIFPDNEEALASYDLILFGKGAEYFLTPARIALLRGFVRDQGGCVIFSRGKPYAGTFPELASIEPIQWGEVLKGRFRFQPTQSGEDTGLFGEMLAGPKDPIWSELPPLQHAHRCARLKAFTHVLVEGVFTSAGKDRSFPAIATRRYGKGMVVVVNAGDLWQWDFFPTITKASTMYSEFWTQLLQWSVTYSEYLPGQEFSLRLSASSVLPGQPIRVRINRRADTTTQISPAIRVMRGSQLIQTLPAVSIASSKNKWELILSLKTPGDYRLELVEMAEGETENSESRTENAEERTQAKGCAALHVKAEPTEKNDFSADRAFLEKLADDSGGRIIREEELVQTVATYLEPVARTVDVSKAAWVPCWDKWWVLGLLLLFFSVEWFARRRSGLL